MSTYDYRLIAGILGGFVAEHPEMAELVESPIVRLAYALHDVNEIDIDQFRHVVEQAAGYEFV